MSHVEVALELRAQLGESPVWDVERQALHLVDILAGTIHRYDPSDGRLTTRSVDGFPGAIALGDDGGYVAGVGLDFVTIAPDGRVTGIARADAGQRINDGKCDAKGRFIAGTMAAGERVGAASLYQLDADGGLSTLLPDVTLSNGLDWAPGNARFYHVDTSLKRVDMFDYDLDTGVIAAREPFVDLTAAVGRPDGLTVDAEGGIWVAIARAGVIHRYDPRGTLDAIIEFPTSIVTSCAFGGRDLDQLFVTSSRALLTEEQRADDPIAGALFVVEGLGVHGRPPNRYRRDASIAADPA